MTRKEADFIGGMNMCDEISNEAYRKIMCHCEEQEPCEDAISREATLDAIIKRLGIKNETYLLEAERVIYQQILAMPSVNPQEPKTGHWIKEYKKSIFTTMYRCSECAILCGNNTFNYCPNCGARMVGEEE